MEMMTAIAERTFQGILPVHHDRSRIGDSQCRQNLQQRRLAGAHVSYEYDAPLLHLFLRGLGSGAFSMISLHSA